MLEFWVSRIMIKLVAVLGALAAVTGCSAADSSSAGQAAQKFITAVAGGGTSACALLAPRARDGLGAVGCGPGSPVGQVPRGEVTATVVWGDEAQARSAVDTLFLHEFPDGWRVTGAGCRLRNEQVYDCLVGGR
jgi:hypothetical protein